MNLTLLGNFITARRESYNRNRSTFCKFPFSVPVPVTAEISSPCQVAFWAHYHQNSSSLWWPHVSLTTKNADSAGSPVSSLYCPSCFSVSSVFRIFPQDSQKVSLFILNSNSYVSSSPKTFSPCLLQQNNLFSMAWPAS